MRGPCDTDGSVGFTAPGAAAWRAEEERMAKEEVKAEKANVEAQKANVEAQTRETEKALRASEFEKAKVTFVGYAFRVDAARQAARRGVSYDALKHARRLGRILRLKRGIYRLRDHPWTWQAQLQAGLLDALVIKSRA